jgi:hypothetical protein
MTLNAIRNHLFDTIPILKKVDDNDDLLKISKEDIYQYGIDHFCGEINSINKDIIELSVFNISDYCRVFLCVGREKERLVYTLDESIENPEIYDLFLEKGTVLAVLEEFINSSVETLKYPMQAP